MTSSSSSRVGELRESKYGVDDAMWVVSYDDVANTHPASELIIEALMRKKRKYVRKSMQFKEVNSVKGLETKTAILNVPIPPEAQRLYPTPVFQKTETIFSDGGREVSERTFNVNLNP